ncbi:MAG: TetR/AcrR family transcriptional regulator [Desulfobacteraceae bacterium]|mgnify:FL=1|nr:MAG: TetR/AcrR family transcriptional regulator [Desulfobacteraceae bacterium]
MAVQKRAINDRDKQKRRDKILRTAWQLYKKTDGKLPTVSVIAQKAGLSKGCVYLYFKTKNEIFLHLFMHQLVQWQASVEEHLRKTDQKLSETDYARICTDYVVKNPLLLKMGSIAPTILEESTDERVVLDVRIQLAKILDDRSRLTRKLFPGLSMAQWMNVHLRIYALIFGLWQMFYNSPHINQVLQNTRIDMFESDFKESVVSSVATFLKGALIAS